jgi:hypothetical protein
MVLRPFSFPDFPIILALFYGTYKTGLWRFDIILIEVIARLLDDSSCCNMFSTPKSYS